MWGCTRDNRSTNYEEPGGGWESLDCWEHDDVKRLDDRSLSNLMLDACTQMKDAYGMTLYTIMVDINDADAINDLKACATSEEHAFDADTAELDDVFASILQSVIRIAK